MKTVLIGLKWCGSTKAEMAKLDNCYSFSSEGLLFTLELIRQNENKSLTLSLLSQKFEIEENRFAVTGKLEKSFNIAHDVSDTFSFIQVFTESFRRDVILLCRSTVALPFEHVLYIFKIRAKDIVMEFSTSMQSIVTFCCMISDKRLI